MTSDTSSPAPPRHKPAVLFKRSQYAINSTPDGELGCYGCVLLKPLKLRSGGWREGEDLMPGTIVPGAVAGRWPIQNRLAMRENKFCRFFLSPEEAAESGVDISAMARRNPALAQAQAGLDDDERKTAARAARAANLAKARQVKAEQRAAAAV